MITPFFFSDLRLLVPEIFLCLSAMLILMIGAFSRGRGWRLMMGLSILALLITAGQEMSDPLLREVSHGFGNLFVTSTFTLVVKAICLVGLALSLMMSYSSLQAEQMDRFEYPVLVLLAGVGMMVMLGAADMLMVYMGLELSSLSLYVLAAFRRECSVSAEAGMKYFILGALSSGMLLFGMSLVYGFTGSTHFDAIHQVLSTNAIPQNQAGVVVGLAFMLAGFAFKVSAVPFHMWTPDVYQGAPSPVTALFAMVPKIAAMGVILALLFGPFESVTADWRQIIAFLSLASMVWGAFGAIAQTNIKRLLAYGAIGNMGYALMGVLAGGTAGVAAVLLYMVIYLFMSAGTFAILLGLRRGGRMIEDISDFAGLSRVQPGAAWGLMMMMFSMAGIPPLAGFFGKLMVFQTTVAAGYMLLAVIGVLSSVVAAFYYLKVIRVIFFDAPAHDVPHGRWDKGQLLVIALSLVVMFGFIAAPDVVYGPMKFAAAGLFPQSAP